MFSWSRSLLYLSGCHGNSERTVPVSPSGWCERVGCLLGLKYVCGDHRDGILTVHGWPDVVFFPQYVAVSLCIVHLIKGTVKLFVPTVLFPYKLRATHNNQ